MARRRRNPGGVLEWCKAHPFLTFFLASSALYIPVAIAQSVALASRPKAPPPPPAASLPPPDPVFVPGVLDIGV